VLVEAGVLQLDQTLAWNKQLAQENNNLSSNIPSTFSFREPSELKDPAVNM
jgi:hypothetical protein